jgi:hypothetical protein
MVLNDLPRIKTPHKRVWGDILFLTKGFRSEWYQETGGMVLDVAEVLAEICYDVV